MSKFDEISPLIKVDGLYLILDITTIIILNDALKETRYQTEDPIAITLKLKVAFICIDFSVATYIAPKIPAVDHIHLHELVFSLAIDLKKLGIILRKKLVLSNLEITLRR
jgi:hypothetical protein